MNRRYIHDLAPSHIHAWRALPCQPRDRTKRLAWYAINAVVLDTSLPRDTPPILSPQMRHTNAALGVPPFFGPVFTRATEY